MTSHRAAVLVAACAASIVNSSAAIPDTVPGAATTAWTVVGPGGGGTMRKPAISPHDPRRVLVGCDMTGAYSTEDAGESWRMFNLGTDVSSFAFDPSNPDVLYAGTAALWRSADRGRTWHMVFPDPARNTRLLMLGDHADQVLRTDDPIYAAAGDRMRVQAIAIGADGTVAIAVSGGGVFRGSDDEGFIAASSDGTHWHVVRRLPGEAVLGMTVIEEGRLALVTERHVLVQNRNGWEDRTGPRGNSMHVASVRATPRSGVIVLAADHPSNDGAASDGLFRSDDGGQTWRDVRAGVTAGRQGQATGWRFRALSASPQEPEVAYVGFEFEGTERRRDRASGIVRTDDGGRTWRVVLSEGSTPSPAMEGSWMEERASQPGPDIWFDAPYDMTVSPTSPDIVYVTDLFRTYRTLDGGGHWTQVHSLRVGPGAWTTRGLDVTTNYGVHADPHDPRRLLMSNTDIGVFRSEDAGASWIPSSVGMPQNWRNTTYWVEFDPAERGLAWGAFSGTHDLPRPKMWRRRDPDTFKGGVGITRNGGRTWAPATGLPVGAATHVLMDPSSPVGRRTVYTTLFGRGVFKSVDGGQTWAAKNQGLPWRQPFAWRLVPSWPARLYLVVARRSEDGSIGTDQDGALYVSDDGADTWRRIPLPAGTNGPTGLLVDPSDPSRLFLSAWGRANEYGDTGGGIFTSADAGAAWRQVFSEGQHVYDVTIDPRTGVLYACGFDQGAWRSTDRGATWQRIAGYTFKWGHRVIPDPATSDRVYITTFGGGVWHGPAAGDPPAAERFGRVVFP